MELYLEGLDCPNCAEKIRAAAERHKNVTKAEVSFPTKKLFLSTDSEKTDEELFPELSKLITDIEPDVTPSVMGKAAKSFVMLLKNVDCEECGEKIRAYAAKMNGVRKADFTYMNGRLAIELSPSGKESVVRAAVESFIAAVEPEITVGEEKKQESLISKQTLVRIIASAVIFAVGMFFRGTAFEIWIFLTAYAIIGFDTVIKAVRNLFHGQPFDECLLMTVASLGAFFIGEFPEGVAVMLLYQVGEMFQSYAVGKSRKSIAGLMNIRPEFAMIKRGEEYVRVSPEEVSIGDIAAVKPGEKIPVDGIIRSGSTGLDTSALTGESVPRTAAVGDEVLSGCINLSGAVEIEVTRTFGESAVSKILELVENSAAKKAKAENFITRFSRVYTPCVVAAALLTAIVPSLVTGAWSVWVYRALSFLVVSCPCALVISVPLSFFCGIGRASRQGVLVKGGSCFEQLAKCKTIVFDKTGTLTNGTFSVTEISPVSCTEEELLALAGMAEKNSTHPAAVSIIKCCKDKGISASDEKAAYEEYAGKGVKAAANGKTVCAGNLKLMSDLGISNIEQPAGGGTIVHISENGAYKGYVRISDTVKNDSAQAIAELKKAGVRTVMLTGDRATSAAETAALLGLDEYHAELLPADKVAELEKIMTASDGATAFVGDGINDAPVLMRADVGIAMGGIGSDAAVEAADIVLMTDEPSRICTAIKSAAKTDRIVRENIIFAIAVKLAILVLTFLGITTMWAAVFADVGVSVIAILNAMRLQRQSK